MADFIVVRQQPALRLAYLSGFMVARQKPSIKYGKHFGF
jgi:hypothetical protein